MPLPYSDVITVDPTTLPVSVEAARRALDLDDGDRDDEIRAWIREAAAKLRHDARLALLTETRVRKLDRFPARDGFLALDSVAPLASVTSIAYVDLSGVSQTFSSASYTVDTARRPGVVWLAYGCSWPSVRVQPNAVTITYTAGYGTTAATVPDLAKQAIISLVRARLDNPDEFDAAYSSGMSPQGYEAAVDYLGWGAYP